MAERTIRVERSGGPQDCRVECKGVRTLLDALERLRCGSAPDLLYRHSCHHGSCGTCGAVVNGEPRLLCLTLIDGIPDDPIVITSLPRATRIGDVAVHPGALFRGIPEGAPSLRPVTGASGPDGPAFRLDDCIECGLCLAACPVTEPFVGPASLAAMHRTRELDAGRGEEMLRLAERPDGVAACERAFACSRACPTGVAPGRRIEELRRAAGCRSVPGELHSSHPDVRHLR